MKGPTNQPVRAMNPVSRRSSPAALLSGFVLVLVALPAGAQTNGGTTSPDQGYRAEFLRELENIEERYLSLAEAIPAEHYGWRPGEGVRSVSEVFMHVAAANFNLPRLVGTPPPDGFSVRGFETSQTEKAQVVDTMRRSFAHLRQGALNASDADEEKEVDWFGGKNTYRGLFLFITRHLAEHLGQSIAYARMNGVVPPWTAARENP